DTWREEKTNAVKVYCRAMLIVRGCYVGEAVGDMDYYTNNASQNYGDAFEGAKTAAFRRCAKEFGIGLQAWRKRWCEGGMQRKKKAPRGDKKTGEVREYTQEEMANRAAAEQRNRGPDRESLETMEKDVPF